MKRAFIYAGAILSAIILILIIFIILNPNKLLSPGSGATILEECKTLSYEGEGAVNILFFSNKNTAKEYSEILFNIKPFSDNRDFFNFYYIDTYKPECEIYKGIAMFCYSKELVKKSSSCPNDHIIVINNENANVRSSSYMNVLSINSQNQKTIIAHEFGHNFAYLADEYVPAKLPRKARNCVASCEKFSDKKDGCFEGCSKENYFRSVNSGIMKSLLSNDYGLFNERLILDKIEEGKQSITGFVIESVKNCKNKEYYLIEGEHSDGEIKIKNKNIEKGCVGKNGIGDFNYALIKTDGSAAIDGEFNPEFIFTDIDSESGEIIGDVLINEGEFLLKAPVVEDSKSFEILSDGEVITEINLEGIDNKPCKKLK